MRSKSDSHGVTPQALVPAQGKTTEDLLEAPAGGNFKTGQDGVNAADVAREEILKERSHAA